LDNAFVDFDTDTVLLDLPHMRNCKPEAIKRHPEVRLLQFKKLVGVVGNYVEGNLPTAGEHS
jgi:hypothetical protein